MPLEYTLQNTPGRIANQVVSRCTWLTNFQPAFVPCQQDSEKVEDEVDNYFKI